MRFDGFDWDAGNREKCRKHGVSVEEIEQLFATTLFVAPDVKHACAETRFHAVGTTEKGRNIFLVFTWRDSEGARLIRPISARFMHREEIEALEKDSPTFQQRR